MKKFLLFFLAAIGMIAPNGLFAQCLTKSTGGTVVPLSYEVLFTPQAQSMFMPYEPSANHLEWKSNGQPTPTLGNVDEPDRYFYFADTEIDIGTMPTGCNTPSSFSNPNLHPQAGCSMPRVALRTDGRDGTYGDFHATMLWNATDTYAIYVDNVLQSPSTQSGVTYVPIFIDHQTQIRIVDGLTGCSLTVTVYPYLYGWINGNSESCDTIVLYVRINTDNPGPVSYLWNTGAVTDTIRVPLHDWYSVTMTNANNYSHVMQVWGPDYADETRGYIEGPDDIGNCQAAVVVYRGIPPFSFEWNDGETDSLRDVHSNTFYSVEITDACGNTDWRQLEVEDISHTSVIYKDSVYVERYTDQYWNVTNLRRDTMPNEWVMITGDSIGTIDSVYIQMRQRLEITITADCNTVTNVDTTETYMLDSTWIKSTAISRSFVTHECLERFVVRTIIYTDTTYLDTLIHKETTVLGEPDTFGHEVFIDSVTCLITNRPYRTTLIALALTDHYSCGVVVLTDTTYAPPQTGSGVDSDTLKNQILRYVFQISTGIASLPEGSITVFPNPATNTMTIQTGLQHCVFEIMDMTGKKIFTEQASNGTLRIDCSTFPTGLYLARITSDDGRVGVEKVIVQRE